MSSHDGRPERRADERAERLAGRFAERERELLRTITVLAAARDRDEVETKRRYAERKAANEERDAETGRILEERYTADRRAEEAAYRSARKRVGEEAAADAESARRAEAADRAGIAEKAARNEQEAKRQLDESVWVTETVYEATCDKPVEQFQAREKLIDAQRDELLQDSEHARTLLRKYRQRIPALPPAGAVDEVPDEGRPADEAADEPAAAARLERLCESARTRLVRLSRLHVGRLFRGYVLPLEILLILVAAGVATAAWNGWQVNRWLAIVVGSTLAVLLVLSAVLYVIARRRCTALYRGLADDVRRGLAACDECRAIAERERDRQEEELLNQRDEDIRRARATYEPILSEIRQRRDHHVQRIEEKYPALLGEIEQRRREELEESEERHKRRIEELEQMRAADVEAAARHHREEQEKTEAWFTKTWSALEKAWKDGMTRCREAVAAIQAEDARLFPAWDDPAWERWTPPTSFSPSVRFGRVAVDMEVIPGGIPRDERLLVPGPARFALPATLDFPGHCSLLLLADGESMAPAVATLQTVMMRLLTSLPPGKVRFTIIDPVGLGQNFAGFMHLADYQESFVGGRIWTETRHIEQRLADLTEHMETVIQKYLRNEFAAIDEYNEYAGEIAEPFRFLVISDFPAGFSETAARRLASIVSSGARCGVYTLISVDRRHSIPKGVELADLEARATTLEFREGAFCWKDDVFGELPLELEQPPPEEFVTHKLHLIGEAARDATRVEVPFAVIAPRPGALWSRECARSLTVPLGRCGATKLQELEIGTGTAQHVLIAGKTGSGKSTLLHVLITNLALWYSPDEVQFYLVDFKKGVEFKTYATHGLPHARAVAVESDREFGLSVLQRIDTELKRRGDRFRELGVQDLAAYRRLDTGEPMPRTLLIVDEFQEMFVEDDKLGQDAALLMDRLVRQGRAFGVHVILGSQTLGGAYTLARSTIGQMQVRIALQCSEADSYLILSDDNAAARLLGRPGEAIYNDAGGAVQGNSPFQIVWLPEAEREERLRAAADLAREHAYRPPEPVIVFEGNAPASLEGNHELAALLDRPGWTEPEAAPAAPHAWLGEAIAIKGPTAAALRRQSGSNLLIVGQRDESALAMMAGAIISLAAHDPPHSPHSPHAPHAPAEQAPERPGEAAGGARFLILDGTPADAPTAGYLERVASILPHLVRCVGWRDVEQAMADLAAELKRRRDEDVTDAAPIYLFIHGLQRFRMLRTSDDFGFSLGDSDKGPSPDRQFADVLRDGAPLGIHTIAWCDTAINLNRTLDRTGLREFEMRVLFQMSGADSTQLIDSPLAGKLGLRRALFYSEEEGILEKFRPYAVPDEESLEDIKMRLERRWGEEAAPERRSDEATEGRRPRL